MVVRSLVEAAEQRIPLELVQLVFEAQVSRNQAFFDLGVEEITDLDQLVFENATHEETVEFLSVDFIFGSQGWADQFVNNDHSLVLI